METGPRVIAIRDSDVENKKLFIYGYGTHVGDRPVDLFQLGEGFEVDNPAIELDNGGTVYGYQCWWGSVEAIEKKFHDFEFIEVDLPVTSNDD